MSLNEFRLVGDFLHGSAILLLIFYIIKNRSCHSVSGLTIILYTLVFFFRYLDLFSPYMFISMYNSIFKIYYLLSSCLLLFLIYGLFRTTRDKLHETFPIFGYFIGAHLLTWVTSYITEESNIDMEYVWRFSIYLEIFAIIPQLILIYKQGFIDKIMTCYLMMLGSYRAFYILNWIDRYQNEQFFEPIGFFSGCIQTIIYLHFFVHIYPRMNKSQPVEITKVVNVKENTNQKTENIIPLIHNVV